MKRVLKYLSLGLLAVGTVGVFAAVPILHAYILSRDWQEAVGWCLLLISIWLFAAGVILLIFYIIVSVLSPDAPDGKH